jgi:hypothetical protein
LPVILAGGVVSSGFCVMGTGKSMSKLSKIPTRFTDE